MSITRLLARSGKSEHCAEGRSVKAMNLEIPRTKTATEDFVCLDPGGL